jgi:hypothetical protein
MTDDLFSESDEQVLAPAQPEASQQSSSPADETEEESEEGESEEEDESDGADEDEESSEPSPVAKPKAKAKARPSRKAAPVVSSEESEAEVSEGEAYNKKERSAKEELVAELLCRWWYALPDWPPKDYDYQQKLRGMHLRFTHFSLFNLPRRSRSVPTSEFEDAPDVLDGRRKCYQLSQFPGVFRDNDSRFRSFFSAFDLCFSDL